MALVKCPDCGSDTSDQAPACPRCGRPVASKPPVVQSRVGVGSGVKLGFGMFVVLPMILFFGGCLLLMTFLGTAASRFDALQKQAAHQKAAEH